MGRKGTRVPGMGAACLHLTGMWTGGAGLFSPEAAAWGAAAWAGGMGVGLGGGCSTQVWLGQLLLGWAEGGHGFASNHTGVSPRARRKVRVSSVLVLC